MAFTTIPVDLVPIKRQYEGLCETIRVHEQRREQEWNEEKDMLTRNITSLKVSHQSMDS